MHAGERVAQVAHELTDPGPMGYVPRREDYAAFLEGTFGRSRELVRKRTSCAIFGGGCLIQAEVQKPRPWPSVFGITSWLALSFSHRAWMQLGANGELVPSGKLPPEIRKAQRRTPQEGDIPYWCSDTGSIKAGGKVYTWTTWPNALNGHVEVVLFDGEGFTWKTAGGGSSLTAAEKLALRESGVSAADIHESRGTICRQSAAPKDLLKHGGRRLRGVWRPTLIAA